MTSEQAIAYLESFVNYERTHQPEAMRALTLERMRRLCHRLGEPQRRFRSVLIAGTDGKGSICAMLYAMLRQTSLRVGLYTSPHLEQFRERIRISGSAGREAEGSSDDRDWISEADLASLVEELQPVFDDVSKRSPEGPLTYFEAVTALAFVYFSRCQVDIAVVEVGLGGRWDATNVLEPSVAVFAPIDLDHTDILGHDPIAIAREKAEIIKPQQTVITAAQPPGICEVLRVLCDARGATLRVSGEDFSVSLQRHSLDGLQVSVVGLRGLYQSLAIPLLGRHQASNAAVAVAALEALSDTGIPAAIVEGGLANTVWPGRLELVHDEPTIMLDGAHNVLAARALRAALEELWPNHTVQLLLGMSSDKSVEAFGEVLGPIATRITCTQSRHPRALDPATVAARLSPYCRELHVVTDPLDAYTYLLNTMAPKELLVVTGSLFLVGQLRAALRQAHVRPFRVVAAS